MTCRSPISTGELFGHTFQVPIGHCADRLHADDAPDRRGVVVPRGEGQGHPYTLSTMGTTTVEDVAATGHPNLWFQLYVTSDRRLSDPLIDRAAEAGYKALEITIDTVVTGRRTRDTAQRPDDPPQLSPRTIVDIGRRPGYWVRMLRSPAIGFANFTALSPAEVKSAASTRIGTLFDHSLNWSDVEGIRKRWRGPLLLKGPIGPADAQRALDIGITGFHLSNHGGRQLDRCTPTIDMLAPLRSSVGSDVPIVIDSGVRHGADIAVAVALGRRHGLHRPPLRVRGCRRRSAWGRARHQAADRSTPVSDATEWRHDPCRVAQTGCGVAQRAGLIDLG